MYSRVIKKLVYPLADLMFGTSMTKYYHQLRESQWWDHNTLQQLQVQKLSKLLLHAYTNVPYYKDFFDSSRLDLNATDLVSAIRSLPILTKPIIKNSFEQLKANNLACYKPLVNKTGGTTGEPLQYLMTKDLASVSWAGMYRGWEWAGYELGDKRVTIAGSSLVPGGKTSLFNKARWAIERNMPLSGVHLTEQRLEDYTKKIIKYKPKFIRGYPSAIYCLADYCKQTGIENIRPKAVFTTAEMLLPHYRSLIEEQFQCKVFDQYGSYDGGIQAMECEEHNGFHISAEKVIVEIVDDDGKPVEPGKTGRIIVTDLHNYAMPFIRYEVGDIGSLSMEQCACGRGLPLLKSLEGRTTDIIKLSNGVTITGPAIVHLFRLQQNIKQYQVIQIDHNKLIVNIVKGENYSEADENHFMHVLKHHAGEGVSISVKYLDTISVTRAGKHRFIINEYDNENKNAN